MGAERRDRSVHDVLGQRQHLGSVGAVPRLDGGTAGDGMQHPLGLFPQGIAAAVLRGSNDPLTFQHVKELYNFKFSHFKF